MGSFRLPADFETLHQGTDWWASLTARYACRNQKSRNPEIYTVSLCLTMSHCLFIVFGYKFAASFRWRKVTPGSWKETALCRPVAIWRTTIFRFLTSSKIRAGYRIDSHRVFESLAMFDWETRPSCHLVCRFDTTRR